jgi:bifunctional non-homologous end joining protein LigD
MMMKVGKYDIEITNKDKVLFGTSGLTKGDLIDYYNYIAPIMLTHVKKRAISMQRFPQGVHKEFFFQKEIGSYFPEWVTTIAVKHSAGLVRYVVIDKAATLVYLANQAVVPHIWLSKIDKLKKPDRIIFDLDPADSLSFADVQYAAKKIKKILDDLALPSFFMLTGSRGAHIVIPIKQLYTFDETREFAYKIAILVAQQDSKRLTIEVHKSKRGERVFIDWLRNGFGATAVAPYAVRALEEAPIAMPVTWDELCKKGMKSQKYTIKNVKKRINSVGDIWGDMQQHAISLTQAQKLLNSME